MVIELKEPGREPGRRQEKVTSMLCPVCKVPLTMSERQGVEIDYCPECRGVWLDRGELDKLIERSAVEAAPALTTRGPDRRDSDDDDYRGRGGHHGGHRRKSWLREIFD